METETDEKSPVRAAIAAPLVLPVKISKGRISVEFAIFGGLFFWAEVAQMELPISWVLTSFSLEKMQSSPPVLALLAVIFLCINGGIRELNLSWPGPWNRLLWMLPLILGGFFASEFAFAWISYLVSGSIPEIDETTKMITDPVSKPFFLLIFPVYAFAEELFYRAYLIQRLERLIPSSRYSTVLAVLLSSAVFALCHLQYGPGKLPAYFFSALLFAGIYVYTNRSIWFVTLVHWLSNTLIVVMT